MLGTMSGNIENNTILTEQTDSTEVELEGGQGVTETQDTEVESVEVPEIPETYEFKAPEGIELDDAAVERLGTVAKDLGLTQEQAQKLLEHDLAAGQETAAAQEARLAEITGQWLEQAKSDKEFGGEQFEANVVKARQVLDRFGTPELKQALNHSGYGNYPELIRMLVRIGKSMAEDKFVGSGATVPDPPKSLAEKLYGGT